MIKQPENRRGTPWDDTENDIIVKDYFDMLDKELKGIDYRKSDHNRKIQSLTGRSKGSVEYKYQNISTVLDILGCPRIKGYLPAKNFQRALIPGVERYLDRFKWESWIDTSSLDSLKRDSPTSVTEEIQVIQQVSIPTRNPTDIEIGSDKEMSRFIRKFDPAVRDARMRNIGMLGEQRVFYSEQTRLRNDGRGDLAKKVRWVSKEDGDGAGYDILSFTSSGKERFLEVKTTIGGKQTPFFISANELLFSEENPEHSRIFRVYDLPRVPQAFVLKPPLENNLILTSQNYRASLRQAVNS